VVTCRQEGGACFMACADGSMTGRPGVAFVTRGPGATNASIGVHVAHQDSQPMILFVGDVARGMQGREGFQEVDFPAFFGPICKWAARIDDPARIPEHVARAYAVAINGRPGPVVLALPEDMLVEHVSAAIQPRPFVTRAAQATCPDAMQAMFDLIADAASPIAIIGGAGWNTKAREYFQQFAERIGLPVATAFRRQDAIAPDSPVYAGNLGYGPNPKLVERVKNADLVIAVGARLGEATTDGYEVPSLEHPGQLLVHIHPDPEELGRVYRTDLALCASVDEFAECAALWEDTAIIPFDAGAEAHREWLEWSTPARSDAAIDLAACVTAMREALPVFGRQIRGFDRDDAVLTGIETRTSSPLRITRDPATLQSLNVRGLFPGGEGAGYAGGILSAGVDGIKLAEAVARSINGASVQQDCA
jgi:acetolactate synthase-1/2/3 large subunit